MTLAVEIPDVDAAGMAAWITPVPEAPGMPRNDALRIAKAFSDAAAFTAWPTAAEELWFGPRYVLTATSGSKGFTFVRLTHWHATPGDLSSDDPAGGHLAVTGFAAPLRPEGFDEESDVDHVLEAVRVGTPVAGSRAVDYMRTAPPKVGYHAVTHSTGASYVLNDTDAGGIFMRQAGDCMLLIQPLPKQTASGSLYQPAGAYSELWRVR